VLRRWPGLSGAQARARPVDELGDEERAAPLLRDWTGLDEDRVRPTTYGSRTERLASDSGEPAGAAAQRRLELAGAASALALGP